MKFENTQVFNFEGAFRGMRNPLQSHSKSDSNFSNPSSPIIGENDLKLAQRLIAAGSEHRKFMRQIFVSVDITAPMYYFSQLDTYKVGVVENSTSKMHTLTNTPITLDCFETNDYHPELDMIDDVNLGLRVECFIDDLEQLRQKYVMTKDKRYWRELIRFLPESFLQTRTVTINYENILSMVHQREGHKLREWNTDFVSWVETLPYAKELILYKKEN